MSKFEFCGLTGDYPVAVSAEKYTEAEMERIARRELMVSDAEQLEYKDCYMRYGFGTNEDGEHYSGWWVVDEKPKRGVKVRIYRVV